MFPYWWLWFGGFAVVQLIPAGDYNGRSWSFLDTQLRKTAQHLLGNGKQIGGVLSAINQHSLWYKITSRNNIVVTCYIYSRLELPEVGGSIYSPPRSSCLQTLIFEWKPALNFNPCTKCQTFRHLTPPPSSFSLIPTLYWLAHKANPTLLSTKVSKLVTDSYCKQLAEFYLPIFAAVRGKN